MHAPPTQLEVALGKTQTLLHAPQLFGSVLTLTSQPSIACPLQSKYPGLHEPTVHVPLVQMGVAFGNTQTLLHAPQLVASADTWTSQPSCELPLQLLKPRGQDTQTLGTPRQMKPGSTVQPELHPSPLATLPPPWSHCSAPLMTPSPQTAAQTFPVHTPPQHWIPDVQDAPTGPHWQTPPAHDWLWQSDPPLHIWPRPQDWQVPPPQSTSVSAPFLIPSLQVGCMQVLN